MMLKLLLLSFIFAVSLSVTCDECWDEYSTCEWNAQSAAYDECANIWEEGSQYPAFVKECIEQQAGNQVECYEEAGCFEAGNQDCWWKLWEFGCSPYQCESYTICTQEFINEQGCGQQLDSCSETCQHPGWKYVYEEIPECIRNHCGEIIQQCATSDACVEGIEGIANTCYNGQSDPTECMDATFIQDAEDTPSALNLCGGDEACSTDLQQIGECIINSQCSEEENQEKFKKLARAVRFNKLKKENELKRRNFAIRNKRRQRRPVPRPRPEQRQRMQRRVRPAPRRSARRKLQSSGGCCECTSSKGSPFCNSECDQEICPLDSYCCNNQWDWICADAAANVCNGEEAYGYTSSYTPYGSYTPFDYGSDNSGSCCDCQSSKGLPYCNQECDSELCPLDPYCCNNSWDWICANSATDVCYQEEQGGYGGYSSYDSYTYYPTPAPSNYDSSFDYSSYDPYSYSNYDYSLYDSYSGYDYSPYDYNSNYYGSYNYPSYDYSPYDSGYDNYYYPSYDYSGYDSYGSDYGYNNYDYSGYDYSGYDSCGPDSCGSGYDEEEWEYDEEEIPTCIKEACGTELAQCASSDTCIEGIEGIANTCYNNNESPVECMNTLITESQGNGALELCNGNEQCATDLQALGECVIQSANYGMCENEPEKKKKELLKGLVKGLKRIKKQRVERLGRRNKQKLGQRKRREEPRFRPRPRLVRRERVSKEERLKRDRARKASLAKRGRLHRRHRERPRPRGAVREQRLRNKMQARPRPGLQRRARQQRASRLASHRRARQERRRRARPAPRRKERRKLQSSEGCCECTDAKGSPFCNSECDAEICPLDSYCCNNQWDWICANAASNVCDGQDAYNYGPYSWDEPSYTPNEYGSENGGSCCECTSSKGEAYCNSECDQEICPLDPYCCNNQWDWICADAASNVCNGQEAYGYNSYDSYYYPSYDYSSYDNYNYPSYDYSSYDPYSYSYPSPSPSYDYSSYDPYSYPSYDYSGYDSYGSDYGYNNYDYSGYGYPSYDDSYYNPSYDYTSYDYSSYDGYNYPSYEYYNSYDSYGYPSYYGYSSDYYGYDSYNANTYSECGEIPDVPECISANCCLDLSQCSSDSQCVSAVEGIAAECDHEDESAIAQCVEDVFINDVEQTKVYELCGGDQLCVESFTSLGQCAFYNCFSSSAQYLVKSLKKSLEFLRTTRADKLKKFNRMKSVRQQRAKTQLKARRQFLKNKELKRVQQQQFNQQRRKYVNKRREFNTRMKAKRTEKVKA